MLRVVRSQLWLQRASGIARTHRTTHLALDRLIRMSKLHLHAYTNMVDTPKSGGRNNVD